MTEELYEYKSARSGGKTSLNIESDYDYKKGMVTD